jgi:hypothetical protein
MAPQHKEINLEDVNLDALEVEHFHVRKGAFNPAVVHCEQCGRRLPLRDLDVNVGGGISVRLHGFKCPKCGTEYLGLQEAAKLDRAKLIHHSTSKGFRLSRRISFDGDNYTLRIPKELTKNVKKRRIEITPLGANEFLARME